MDPFGGTSLTCREYTTETSARKPTTAFLQNPSLRVAARRAAGHTGGVLAKGSQEAIGCPTRPSGAFLRQHGVSTHMLTRRLWNNRNSRPSHKKSGLNIRTIWAKRSSEQCQ